MFSKLLYLNCTQGSITIKVTGHVRLCLPILVHVGGKQVGGSTLEVQEQISPFGLVEGIYGRSEKGRNYKKVLGGRSTFFLHPSLISPLFLLFQTSFSLLLLTIFSLPLDLSVRIRNREGFLSKFTKEDVSNLN